MFAFFRIILEVVLFPTATDPAIPIINGTLKFFFPKAYCEYPEKYKDNICDDANNEEKCGFDGEDCCLGMLDYCEICMCHLIGNLGCLY